MANCKICGRPVRSANVFHSACWESVVKTMAETFCADYCRWPRGCTDQDSLDELHCSDCALVRLVNLGL